MKVINVIGQDTRENVHQKGLLHREIHIIIYNDKNEILFQKRSMSKDTFPGLLDVSIGGHVDLSKDYKETALKELEEEAGIVATQDALIFIKKRKSVINDKLTGKINNAFRSIFSYEYDGDISGLKIEIGEIDGFEFWSLDKILNLTESEKANFIDKFISGKYLEIYKELLNK